MNSVIVKGIIMEVCLTYVNFNKLIRLNKEKKIIQIPYNNFVISVKLRPSLRALRINQSINHIYLNT